MSEMNDAVTLRYDVDGNDFTRAGEASANVKKTLRQLGICLLYTSRCV